MLTEESLRKVVARHLGLEYFGAGSHEIKNSDGEILHVFEVIYVWCATIRYFHTGNREVIVAVAQSETWRKGILLIPDESGIREFVGSKPPAAIDISEWEDPVALALHSVDLLKTKKEVMRGPGLYWYDLVAYTLDTKASFSILGAPRNPSLQNLWHSILSMTYRLVDLQDDAEIHQIVEYKRRLFRVE